MRRGAFEQLTGIKLWTMLTILAFIASFNKMLAQSEMDETIVGNEISENVLEDLLTVYVTPDSILKYHGWSPSQLNKIISPYGEAIVIGNNAKDAAFLPSESIDGLGDFTISFYVKINGFNHFNNILSLANEKGFNELIVAYNNNYKRKGILITVEEDLYEFPGTETVLNDLGWHHILIVRSSTRATLLVDGSLKGSSIDVSSGLLEVDPGGFVIGQDQDALGGGFEAYQSFNGAIADLKIYKYALEYAKLFPMAYSECPTVGTPCDDGSLNTIDDREDGKCNCLGTPEIKEQELAITKTVSQQRATKNKLLFYGLIVLSLIGLGVIYFIIHRRKIEKAKLEKRNSEEKQKRELAEIELAYKQKELTAKVLQLASKNEFLSSLENEMKQLHSTTDTDVNVSSRRISKMIEFDAADEEMWDQFSKEFMVLHSDFIEKICEEFGTFTKTEIRLISLMKMNLSSKDIMGILRISETGIKKARYRLRKKMKLDSKINLQDFMLSYKT